ncbi:MAG: SsrA-binding protein SmpB [Candidatus Dojkabacteria bacterium]
MKIKVLAKNKRAYFDYELLETFEAGIELLGQEVKSIRNGGISLGESYIREIDQQLWLWNASVTKYRFSSDQEYDPLRTRRLLLSRSEIEKLQSKAKASKLTIVPTKIYSKGKYLKLEIALARGKKRFEKQAKIKERELDRELHREKRKYMVE